MLQWVTSHSFMFSACMYIHNYYSITILLIFATGPSQTVQNLNVSILSSSSVELSWTPPPRSTWNGIFLSYSIVTLSHGPNNVSAGEDPGFDPENSTVLIIPVDEHTWGNSPDPRFNNKLVAEEMTVEELHEFFTYQFTVFVTNSAGDSDPATTSVIEMPGAGMYNTLQ